MIPLNEYLLGKTHKKINASIDLSAIKHRENKQFLELLDNDVIGFFDEIVEEGPVNDKHLMLKYECERGRYKMKAYGVYIVGMRCPLIRKFGYASNGEPEGLNNGEYYNDGIESAATQFSNMVRSELLKNK